LSSIRSVRRKQNYQLYLLKVLVYYFGPLTSEKLQVAIIIVVTDHLEADHE
jgi:hypothetical protein